jgi:hypothetical protein
VSVGENYAKSDYLSLLSQGSSYRGVLALFVRRKETTMALQKGEKYRCPDTECGCEIEVTKGAAPGKGGDQAPRCCCGKEMQK